MIRKPLREGLRAGTLAALVSGLPSTVCAVATRRDPLEATLAAGSLLLPTEEKPGRLLAAAIPAHFAISAFWGTVLATAPPLRRTISAGAVAGLGIGVFDLLVIGRHFPRIRALPLIPQLADHVAFGVAVAALLKVRGRALPR